MSDNVLFYL
jgi:hypothetical protein